MFRRVFACVVGAVVTLFVTDMASLAEEPRFRSHPPVRPLPTASDRPLAAGPSYFVDATRGDDVHAGSAANPWKTVQHAAARLKAGDTLYLRGGTYFEHVTITCSGTPESPITIRSYPGELVQINGGIREFVQSPEAAWEPCPEGVEGEFRSREAFPDLGGPEEGCHVLGNFGDSLLPLMGYRFLVDLRDPSMEWDVEGKVDGAEGVYCGPGVYYANETGRIHVRLAHTNLRALGDENYRGETDPRRVPLMIAGSNAGPVLTLRGARHLRFQDLVVCGARTATIDVSECRDLSFEDLNVYGGSAAFGVKGTTGLRIYHTACRGIAAPWTFRGHLKYRSIEARIFSASSWMPTPRENEDFELAYSEFTDSVDGVFIGNAKNVHFHHNLVDNVSDDGLFLTAGTAYDGTTHGGEHFISQNLLSRCLTTFAFGVGHGRQKMTERGRQTGSGAWIFRNVFDFRRPVHYQLPAPNDAEVTTHGRMAGDHGGPAWEPMTIYHNTIVETVPLSREWYLSDLGGHLAGGNMRRLFNNVAVQSVGIPGKRFPEVIVVDEKKSVKKVPGAPKTAADPLADLLDSQPAKHPSAGLDVDAAKPGDAKPKPSRQGAPLSIDFQADGNLHWGIEQQPSTATLFESFRNSSVFASSRKLYPPGWGSHDVVADPEFEALHTNWREPLDLSLTAGSPALDAGVVLPETWPDPVQRADSGAPDIGALPAGATPWRIGVRGRLTMFGNAVAASDVPVFEPVSFPAHSEEAEYPELRPALIVQGYPAFDGELIRFALERHNVPVQVRDRAWLETGRYADYRLVVIVGDLVRSGMQPNRYGEADLWLVQKYLEDGGTLLLMRAGRQVFDSQQGRYGLSQLVGSSRPRPNFVSQVRMPAHPWFKHLDPQRERSWIARGNAIPLLQDKGEAVLGSEDGGAAMLLRVPIGKGQLAYLGWEISDSRPNGRGASTPAAERDFEEQVQILQNVVADVYQSAPR